METVKVYIQKMKCIRSVPQQSSKVSVQTETQLSVPSSCRFHNFLLPSARRGPTSSKRKNEQKCQKWRASVSNTVKMKFFFVLLLLLDIPHLRGQQIIQEFEHVLLRFTFPSFYNNYNKFCCKLYPGGCYKLFDSTGFICDLLKGRVTKTERDGWIEFKISNVGLADGGFYRCIVVGIQNHIYSDYLVEVSDVSGHRSPSQTSLTTTVRAPYTSKSLPQPSEPALAQDHSDSARVSWSFGLPIVIIVSVTVMIFITSLIGVIYCRVNSKCTDKYRETQSESLKQEAPEISNIVYTTVDFKAHQKPTELYANLRMHKTQVGGPDSTWMAEHDGMVEYSTLAVHK